MPAFSSTLDLDWKRIDVTAIVTHGGVATVRTEHADSCVEWLSKHAYEIARIDCSGGFGEIRRQLGQLFRWRDQFGYDLDNGTDDPPNLDALRDGFNFELAGGRSQVLKLDRSDLLWARDARWTAGLLAIAAEHSRVQLALGCRFFALLVLPNDSPLLGAAFDQLVVPCFGWNPLPAAD